MLFGGDTRRDPEFARQAAATEASIAAAIAALIDVEGIDPAHQALLAHGLVGLAEGASRRWLAAPPRRPRRAGPSGGRAGLGRPPGRPGS